jgi:hypothetical protein
LSLDHVKVFCVVDGKEVPPDRKKRRSITCSDACAAARNSYLREKKELKKCKYCSQPSTPEERTDFRLWRAERRAQAKAAKKLAVAE